MVPVEGREAEGIGGQCHGTVSLVRLLALSRSVREVSRFLVVAFVMIAVVAVQLPLVVLPRLAFDLDRAGLRWLGHLDLNPHPAVVPLNDGFALDREISRRSRRRRTRRAGVLVAAAYAGLLHPRGFTRRRRGVAPRATTMASSVDRPVGDSAIRL